jgi:hypothetical protein
VGHGGVNEPVSREYHIGLSRDRLRQIEKLAGSLREALRGNEYGFLEVLGGRRQRGVRVQL